MFRILVLALIFCFLVPTPNLGVCEDNYAALGSASDQPINITSKRFSAKNIPGGKEVTFEGSVKVQQSDLVLTCDRLVILYDEKMAGPATTGPRKNS